MKVCPSYPGYSITKSGRVFSHRRRYGKGIGKGGGVVIDARYRREMNPYLGHGGYIYVSISTFKGQRSVGIHTLLLDAFVGPRPYRQEIRHLDGNRKNYALSNLCYGTRKQNAADRILHGHQRGREILDEAQVQNIRHSMIRVIQLSVLLGSTEYQKHVQEMLLNERLIPMLYNAKRGYGWDVNCWVWVLTFKKAKD